MNSEAGRAWFQVAVFITLVSGALLFFVQPGTAEFVITVTTLGIGVTFMGAVVLAVKRANR